jgi:amino acid transporter
MTLPIKNALEGLTVMKGWRVLIMLPPQWADPKHIIELMPWVQNGKARPATLMVRFMVDNGLALVTGGVLTEEEGKRLFSIHDQLKGIATKMFVIPPASAPASLIARMYDSGATPSIPIAEDLPNPRKYSVSILVLLFLFLLQIFVALEAIVRGRMDLNSVSKTLVSLLFFAIYCAVMWWRRKRQLRDIVEDPVRMAIMEWTPTLPPFGSGTS